MTTVEEGLSAIENFNAAIEELGKYHKSYFHTLYKEKADYFLNKWLVYDPVTFFLSLDYADRAYFLSGILHDKFNLDFPEIEVKGWEIEKSLRGHYDKLPKEGMGFLHFCILFGLRKEIDVIPNALYYITKWCLFSVNNSIDESEYEGNKYGNLQNWINYFSIATYEKKIEIVNRLTTYN